jgi:urease accessory protein
LTIYRGNPCATLLRSALSDFETGYYDHDQMKTLTRAIASGLLLVPALAHAHPGHGTSGLEHGFVHPISGLDHLLAMIAVGLWAGQLGGRARWQVPAAFLGVMILGCMLGMAGVAVPAVEQGIVASVLILGVLIAAAVRLPAIASIAIVAGFAFFHGAAHGTEMPANATGLGYAGGFTIATGLLHAAGLGLGMIGSKLRQPRFVRLAGGVIALCAIVLAIE